MLGVHFAITAEQEKELLGAGSGILGDLEESWAEPALKVDTDKAWDAIARSLGDDYPLSHVIDGGRELPGEIYAVLTTAAEVRDVAAALLNVDEATLLAGFDHLWSGDDFTYIWDNFVDVRDFYQRAAAAGRAVIFTAT